LRQDGAVYRFRHLRLLEHLAGPEEKPGLLETTLIRYGVPLYQSMSRIGIRVMDQVESRLQRDAGLGLQVVREGFTATYRDSRIDRWPRFRQPSDEDSVGASHVIPVVVDRSGMVLGRRPPRWRLAVAAAILPFGGTQRARQYLARHAGALLPSADVIRDMDDRNLRIVELIRSSTSLVIPTTIQPGEPVLTEFRQHPYVLVRIMTWSSVAMIAGVILALRTPDGINLFEFAGLLTSVWGVAWGLWKLAAYQAFRFLITNKRIIEVGGLVTRQTREKLLTAVGELTCDRSLPGAIWNFGTIHFTEDLDTLFIGYEDSPLGRLLSYGTLLFDYEDMYTRHTFIDWVPRPVSTYRLLVDAAEASRNVDEERARPDSEPRSLAT